MLRFVHKLCDPRRSVLQSWLTEHRCPVRITVAGITIENESKATWDKYQD